jgi:glycosyltransferase involved in cell wall biosynthesis
MMCGVPVISTNVGSITELVADQSTGIIVPAKNADDLAAAIQVLLANSQRREQLAKMGQSTVLSNFSLDIMIRKMETVFVATRCS